MLSAASVIVVVLFISFLLVAGYYVCLFYEKPPDEHEEKPYRLDEGPLLAHQDDFNANDPPMQPIDEPDEMGYVTLPKVDENLVDLPEKKPNQPSAPDCEHNADFPPVILNIENEKTHAKAANSSDSDSSNEAPPTSLPHRAPSADRGSQKSDEEDGLVYPSILQSVPREPDPHMQTPKRVHFMPSPITVSVDVTEEEEQPDDVDRICIGPGSSELKPTNIDDLERPAHAIPDASALHTNPTHSSSQSLSSSEASTSETDTSEPDVTEYSFETGPMVPSTSSVLANEISTSMDPQVTRISKIPEPLHLKPDRPVSPQNTKLSDQPNKMIVCPSEESLNTPPSTPPEGVPTPDILVLDNPGAEYFTGNKNTDNQRSPKFVCLKSNDSYSSSCSSSDEGEHIIQPDCETALSQVPPVKK